MSRRTVWHERPVATKACSYQGQLQHLASQQASEPALNALINGGKRILHVSLVLRQMRLESTQLQSARLQVHMTLKMELLSFLPTSCVLVDPGSMSDVLL